MSTRSLAAELGRLLLWLLLVFLMWLTFALSPEPWSDLNAFISTGWAGWLGWFAGAWFAMSPLGQALREAPDV